MLRENSSMAARNGRSSRTTSTISASPIPCPMTRIGPSAGRKSVAKAPRISLSQWASRRSTTRSTSGNRSSRAKSRRLLPPCTAIARAPTPARSFASKSALRRSEGEASSTKAAICAAAMRSESQLRRKLATEGT